MQSSPEVPDHVIDLVGPLDIWEELPATSPGSSRVWLTDGHAIKWAPIDELVSLTKEATNGRWLHERFPCAGVVDLLPDGWLITERLAGVPAHRVDLHGNAEAAAHGAAKTLAALHALPIGGAPFAGGWDGLAHLLTGSVERGAVDATYLPEPYSRYAPEELLTIWRQGRPLDEELVISHGDPSLPNILLDQGELTGVVDLGGMRVVDRHFDLAIAQRSVQRNLGGDAVFLFFETYEEATDTRTDLIRLDHYHLGSLLVP